MELNRLRNDIDTIDEQIVALFLKRMEIASQIATYKKQQGLLIFVPDREAEVLNKITSKVNTDMQDYICRLYQEIFEISKDYQIKQL